MRIFRSLAEIEPPLPQYTGTAVTIGKFDGVHIGHQAILNKLTQIANDRNLRTAVITFTENPLSVLRPEICPEPLSSPAQRLAWLEAEGVHATVMIPFDRAFSGLSAHDFVRDVLVGGLRAGYVIVGADFRFGHGGVGTVDVLRQLGAEYGFEVEVVDDVIGDAGDRVSSTMVRSALSSGDVAHAAQLLGRVHRVSGTVVRGDARGRTLGFPTANVGRDVEGFVPAEGVYAGWLSVAADGENEDEAPTRYPAAISIGSNPTFEGERESRIEVFVIDATIDLYDKRVHVDFVQRLRPTLTFDSADALVEQMHADVAEARSILGL